MRCTDREEFDLLWEFQWNIADPPMHEIEPYDLRYEEVHFSGEPGRVEHTFGIRFVLGFVPFRTTLVYRMTARVRGLTGYELFYDQWIGGELAEARKHGSRQELSSTIERSVARHLKSVDQRKIPAREIEQMKKEEMARRIASKIRNLFPVNWISSTEIISAVMDILDIPELTRAQASTWILQMVKAGCLVKLDKRYDKWGHLITHYAFVDSPSEEDKNKKGALPLSAARA